MLLRIASREAKDTAGVRDGVVSMDGLKTHIKVKAWPTNQAFRYFYLAFKANTKEELNDSTAVNMIR